MLSISGSSAGNDGEAGGRLGPNCLVLSRGHRYQLCAVGPNALADELASQPSNHSTGSYANAASERQGAIVPSADFLGRLALLAAFQDVGLAVQAHAKGLRADQR